ncbi:MAG: LON peptidase substrate-binding domain-containing protein, partial [Acidimicrobiia bacterium]|nr:LON peptidase substrate-binding domain-containing protein [Acidimicrobiia bacterium]
MDELQTRSLPLLPLTSGVVLPGMVVTMAVESDDAGAALSAARNGDGRLVLVPRLENGRYANVGTVAAVETAGELPSGLRAVVVR